MSFNRLGSLGSGFGGMGGGRGGGLRPPPGFIFLVDQDGAYLTDADGYYLVEAI